MKQTAILLPIDNRPITYAFPQSICELAGLDALVPPKDIMGSLSAPTDISAVAHWLKHAVCRANEGAVFICLDSLLYGGLIPGRRNNESLEIILSRASLISKLKRLSGGKLKIYAQSSIMRISDNYDNSEEKQYWAEYGREIFHWSELLHKKEIGLLDSPAGLKAAEEKIPVEIRQDYLATRNRNFAANEKIIEYAANGDIDYLIFSQDDSGKYGLNVFEKNQLMQIAKDRQLTNIRAYAGADEVLMTLIAFHLNSQRRKPVKILIEYSSPSGKDISSNYEGQSIGESVECQASAQGLYIASGLSAPDSDFTVIIHTGLNQQGDHIWLPGLKDLRSVNTSESAARALKIIEQSKTPVVICDVAYSNGGDPVLIDLLLQHPHLFKRIWSYAGWNTTGNTIGCALSTGCACLYAASNNHFEDAERSKLLFLRLLDDWAYQTQVRKQLQTTNGEHNLTLLMEKYANILANALSVKSQSIDYNLPWQRNFEVEITV